MIVFAPCAVVGDVMPWIGSAGNKYEVSMAIGGRCESIGAFCFAARSAVKLMDSRAASVNNVCFSSVTRKDGENADPVFVVIV
jgi:hypothetical protein